MPEDFMAAHDNATRKIEAPVFGADGGLVGAVSVSTLYRDAVNYEELGQVVLKKARQLSEMLGYIR